MFSVKEKSGFVLIFQRVEYLLIFLSSMLIFYIFNVGALVYTIHVSLSHMDSVEMHVQLWRMYSVHLPNHIRFYLTKHSLNVYTPLNGM